MENATQRVLMYGVLPMWFVPAVADWVMHRRTDIEKTTGVKESAIHALMMAEAGVPVLAGLVARINPLVLTMMGGAAAVHSATAIWDVTVATEDREVRPVEQHIHSFLEVLPLAAVVITSCLHWESVRDLAHGGKQPDAWKLLPEGAAAAAGKYLAGIAAGVGAFVALPYAEEFIRCVRARKSGA
ncbi:Diguanylate cyclase OS=Streptomyces rimosus subsp. rimosus (strain ATCC / DSM 40260/ JCM 4667 / NRRL 2234) OX=1265868 GN=SRIM_032500 PE=4 SV=1 [Streptomyces rimosus subsp. rimosus]